MMSPLYFPVSRAFRSISSSRMAMRLPGSLVPRMVAAESSMGPDWRLICTSVSGA